MIEIVAMALAASMGLIFLVLKFGRLRRILAFDIGIDIALTALLMFSMAGTYTGIMVAIFAGGIISATFYALKKCFPPDSLTARGWVKSDQIGLVDYFHRATIRV